MKFFALILCLLPSTLAWWKHTIIYEIYPSSFKDSNGDGFGDLNGITQKLPYLRDLNIGAVHITPIFESPMLDNGYDVSNYTAINPLYGTMKDFDRLMKEAKKRGIHVIGDLVLNHSSDEHPWFKMSIDRIEPYTDFYVWADPKGYTADGTPIPPNNWISIFEGSAWEWNTKREQFYFHQFAPKQPDFNLRSEALKTEFKKIMKFWFDKGINGFRLDATKHFVEDEQLRDEPLVDPKMKKTPTYYDLKHVYTVDLWESYEFIHELRQFVDDYNRKHGEQDERIFMAESYTSLQKTMDYYDKPDYNITHFPYNFKFVSLNETILAKTYESMITRWLENMPAGARPNWMSENHDNLRIGTKVGEEYQDIVTITIMTLPGISCIYYGQEIGMKNYALRPDQRRDPNNDGSGRGLTRDGERLPMQWDDSQNAGFTTNHKPWLPVNPDYWKVNVKTEKADRYSRYHMFKTLSNLRKTKAMKHGDFVPHIISDWVYCYVRSSDRSSMYVIILNLGTETEIFDLREAIPHLPRNLKVVTASQNAGYKPGERVHPFFNFLRTFVMRPTSAVVLTAADDCKTIEE